VGGGIGITIAVILTVGWIFFVWRFWKRQKQARDLGPGSKETDEYQKTELDGTGKPLGELDAEGLHKLPEKQAAELESNAIVELPEKQVAELEGNIVAELHNEGVPELPGDGSFSQVVLGEEEYKPDVKVECADGSAEDGELLRLGVNGT
jgi:hypothetical protein